MSYPLGLQMFWFHDFSATFFGKERDLDLGRVGWPFGAANIPDLGDF